MTFHLFAMEESSLLQCQKSFNKLEAYFVLHDTVIARKFFF